MLPPRAAAWLRLYANATIPYHAMAEYNIQKLHGANIGAEYPSIKQPHGDIYHYDHQNEIKVIVVGGGTFLSTSIHPKHLENDTSLAICEENVVFNSQSCLLELDSNRFSSFGCPLGHNIPDLACSGMAGLSAARTLLDLGLKDVLVLEGNAERVGGRTSTFATPDGDLLEEGAEWVHDWNHYNSISRLSYEQVRLRASFTHLLCITPSLL